MQNQIYNGESSPEEIYQEMTRDAFGVLEKRNSSVTNNSHNGIHPQQIEKISKSKYKIFFQELLNTLTAQFQLVIPGAFRITHQPEQCLSYANLQSWSPGRAYFSLFEMKKSRSIWILHFSRSIGEKLAYLVHKTNSKSEFNIYNSLREADSIVYLEIGDMLRSIFFSLIELWPKSNELNIFNCKHVLHLGFLRSIQNSEEYVILPFNLDNKECSGEFHLIVPQKYLIYLSN